MMHTFKLVSMENEAGGVKVTCLISLIGVAHNQQVVTHWPDYAAAHRYLHEESKQAFWAALDRWSDYIMALCPYPSARQASAAVKLRDAHRKIGEKQADCSRVTRLITNAGDILRDLLPEQPHPHYHVLLGCANQCVQDAHAWLQWLETSQTQKAA
jgi:hypothetical protein